VGVFPLWRLMFRAGDSSHPSTIFLTVFWGGSATPDKVQLPNLACLLLDEDPLKCLRTLE